MQVVGGQTIYKMYSESLNRMMENEILAEIFNGVQNIGLYFLYPYIRLEQKFEEHLIKEAKAMKGYTVESGYMGYVNGEYMLFASEMDYEDYMEK